MSELTIACKDECELAESKLTASQKEVEYLAGVVGRLQAELGLYKRVNEAGYKISEVTNE